MINKQLCLSLSTFACLIYLGSLALPSFRCATKSFLGYEVLAIGFLDPRWLANIGFAVLAYCNFRKPKRRPRIATWAAVLALCSIFPAAGCTGAGGAPGESTALAIGGVLWAAAVCLMCVANQYVDADLPD